MYRPKYRIIAVENKSSRILLNFKLVHRFNTNNIKLNLLKLNKTKFISKP